MSGGKFLMQIRYEKAGPGKPPSKSGLSRPKTSSRAAFPLKRLANNAPYHCGQCIAGKNGRRVLHINRSVKNIPSVGRDGNKQKPCGCADFHKKRLLVGSL
jgi:hypothetical protein